MVAGLAAELEDQNVINEGYLSSAECNALVVSACRAPLRKVTRLVRSPAGADDHMVTRFFRSGREHKLFAGETCCASVVGFVPPDVYHHRKLVGSRCHRGTINIVVEEDGDDNGLFREEVLVIVKRPVACAFTCEVSEARSRLQR